MWKNIRNLTKSLWLYSFLHQRHFQNQKFNGEIYEPAENHCQCIMLYFSGANDPKISLMSPEKVKNQLVSLLLLAVSSLIGHATAMDQISVEMAEDSIPAKKRISPFLMGHFQYGQFSDRWSFFGGVGLGVLIHGRWQLEADYTGIINRYKKQIIFPVEYRLRFWHVGGALKYNAIDRKKWYGFASLRGGAGRVEWIPLEGPGDHYTDNVYLLTPEIGIGFRLLHFMSIEYALGYHQAFDVEIIGLEQDAFNGIEMKLTIKIIKSNRGR
jgi:hypothetical protein